MSNEKRPKIALVAGTGGLRPIGGLELQKFLDEEGIKVDLLVGCSGGAALCSSFALGWSYEQAKKNIYETLPRDIGHMLDFRKVQDFLKVPSPNFSPTRSIIDGPVWVNSMRKSYGNARLEDLKVPFLVQTTDLLTGKGVVFDKGDMTEIVSASCSFFPLFSPIPINGRYYMDGSFSNSQPVIEAVKRNPDVILVVTVYDPPDAGKANILKHWWNFIRNADTHETKKLNDAALAHYKGKVVNIDVVLDAGTEVWDLDSLPGIFKSFKEGLEKYKKEIVQVCK
jgi:NTE family protein